MKKTLIFAAGGVVGYFVGDWLTCNRINREMIPVKKELGALIKGSMRMQSKIDTDEYRPTLEQFRDDFEFEIMRAHYE